MIIPLNQPLVIKGVSMVKKEAITDALSRQGLLLERNNPNGSMTTGMGNSTPRSQFPIFGAYRDPMCQHYW